MDPIYIYDNGEDYSDHSIAFIRSHWPEDVTTAAVNAAHSPYSRQTWTLVGVARDFDWRDESGLSTIVEWVALYVGNDQMMAAIGVERAAEVVAYLRSKPKLWPGEVDAVETAENRIAAVRTEAPDGR